MTKIYIISLYNQLSEKDKRLYAGAEAINRIKSESRFSGK
ncbi:hypothetical protein GMMP15_80005 [Candidatus Magnetomoraceae bacterium gMMP-15]